MISMFHLFKQVEESSLELERRAKDLEVSNAELKEFAYVVSHDLKAPLRGMTSISEWLKQDYQDKLDEKGQKFLGQIRDAAVRMNKLVDGILEYSRVGRDQEEIVSVDLNEVIESARLLADPEKKLNYVIPKKLPYVFAGKIRVQQIFQNFFSNIIKYAGAPEVKITYQDAGRFWRLGVQDRGHGIDKKYHKKIFQLFQMVDDSHSADNTGVGLALIKRIVEFYGGYVLLESKEGEGVTFYFTLPKAEG